MFSLLSAYVREVDFGVIFVFVRLFWLAFRRSPHFLRWFADCLAYGVLLIFTMSRVWVYAYSTGSVYRNTITIIQYCLFAHTMQLSGPGESIEYMSGAIKLSIKFSISRFIAFYVYTWFFCLLSKLGRRIFHCRCPNTGKLSIQTARGDAYSVNTAYTVNYTSTGTIAYTPLSHAHVQRHDQWTVCEWLVVCAF